MRTELTREKYLTEEEYESLKRDLLLLPERDRVLVELALVTGARASELLGIQNGDLDHKEYSVYIRGLKNSRDRQIPLNKDLFTRVHRISLAHREGRAFDFTYQRLVQIWSKVRPAGKSFHSLRHTFAINLYKRTHNIKLVQLALGHKQIANTMIYADFVYSQSEMRKFMRIKL